MQPGEPQSRSIRGFEDGFFVDETHAEYAKRSELDENVGDEGKQGHGLLKRPFTHEIPSEVEIEIFDARCIVLEFYRVFQRTQSMLAADLPQYEFNV